MVNQRSRSLSLRVRASLASALAFLLLNSSLVAFAQQSALQDEAPTPRQKSPRQYTAAPDAGFVIYETEDGRTACRVATPEESRAFREGAAGGRRQLRQINHLEDGRAGANAGTSAAQAAVGLTIILRATSQLDANPEAKNAFIAAAAKWEALIQDAITVVIDVDYGTTAFGQPFPTCPGSQQNCILGQTSSQGLFSANNYPTIRSRLIQGASTAEETTRYNSLPTGSLPTDRGTVNTVVVQTPNLRALGLLGPDARNDTNVPGDPPSIAFNSSFGFDFNPSDGITGNRTDFDAVAVHEIGHALGFDSMVGAAQLQTSSGGLVTGASVWDFFRFRPGAAPAGGFTNTQRVLTVGSTPSDPHVHFDGGNELPLATGNPDGDENVGDGDQASHWKDDAKNGGLHIGVMDPNIPRNTREVMSNNDRRAIDFFGFRTGALPPPPAAPANDNFTSAQLIFDTPGSINGTNIGATEEAGEPNHEPNNNAGGRSVWYRWTPAFSGSVTIDTVGSNFDTLLAVYTGGAVGSLTRITSNDDIAPGNVQSRVTFTASGGTTYNIAVDGFNDGGGADIGNITLNWTQQVVIPPNTVQFNASASNVTEGANPKVDITVTRTGDTTGAATVNYATNNGTASDRSDYIAAHGTLRFGPNETSKTFSVFIVNDAHGNGAGDAASESVSVVLSNPVGCTLGTPSTQQVNIANDDAANGPNPVRDETLSADFFVRQHYIDFLNREVDAPGLAFWTNQINECGANTGCRELRKINVSAAFFLSIEFQETGYLVYRAHQAVFNTGKGLPLRTFLADTQEIGRGVVIGQPGADLLLEQNKVRFFDEFVRRPEFLAVYPQAMTAANFFVDTLNSRTGGSLSSTERNDLVNQLGAGQLTRAQVLRRVAEDSDFTAREKNNAFVLMQYFGYLRRAPNEAPNTDFSGYDFWLTKLNQFGGNFVSADMVKSFLVSGEYIERFGP